MAEACSKIVPSETLSLWPDRKYVDDCKGDDDFQPMMEAYLLPDDGKDHPAIVIYPGGGYAMRAPHEGVDIAERFNRFGFQSFVVQYRVAPYRFPAPQQDAFRGIKLVRANAERWHVLTSQVVTCGFSAGGHLCSCTGTMFDNIDASAGDAADAQSQRPDALILCYPVISFSREFGHRGSGENLLGDRLEELEDTLSTDKLISSDTPPSFLWHTAEDQAVPVANSLRYAEAMQRLGKPWGLHVFPAGHHGLGLAPDWKDISRWPELARDFLRDNCGFNC